MELAVANSLSQIRECSLYHRKIEKGFSTISDTIKRNNMLTFANRPNPKKKGTKDRSVQRQNMMLITQLFSHVSHFSHVPMPTLQTSFGSKIRESHRALRIVGWCGLVPNQTFLSASMPPLAAQLLKTIHRGRVGYVSCYPHGATYNSTYINRVCVAPEYPLRDRATKQELWPHNTSAMQPFRGGHQDTPASGTCGKAGSYKSLRSHCWQ